MEDAENGIPDFLRATLALSADHYRETRRQLDQVERQHRHLINQEQPCKALLALEGAGSINALGLYLAIGDGSAFKNGRDAAACIGVTPKQHSTAGTVKFGLLISNWRPTAATTGCGIANV